MLAPSGPPEFDQQDWSQFDFSRWHLDGLALEDVSTAVAELAQRLFGSAEWRQDFRATLPGLQSRLLEYYKGCASGLQAEAATLTVAFEQRTADLPRAIAALQARLRGAPASPPAPADPVGFQAVIRVATGDAQLGLPDLVVRLIDPREKGTTLVESVTDLDGNAFVSLPGPTVEELTRAKQDLTVEILGPEGQSLQMLAQGLCPRAGQTETKVVVLPRSPDLQTQATAALQLETQWDERLRNLLAKLDRLAKDYQAMQAALSRRLEHNQAIIAELEKEKGIQPAGPAAG
jgi:hypothetical protein